MSGTIELGNVVKVSAGQPAPKPGEFTDQGVPFIRAGSLAKLLNGHTEDDCEKIPEDVAARKKFRLYPEDTIVFAKSGMSAKIGRVYRLRKPSFIVSHLAALAPTGKYDPSFLAYWLRSHPPSRLIKDEAYPSIRTSDISALQVPKLPMDEQRRIAAILDKADAIRRKREQALTLADDLLKSTFLEMFGDPVTNPMGWMEVPLGEISDITSGLTKGRKVKPEQTLRSLPYMRVANVQDGFLDLSEIKEIEATETEIGRFRLLEGDLLLTEGGDPDKLGRGCVWRQEIPECIHQNHIFRVRVDQSVIIPGVLSRQIGSRRGKDYFLRAAKQTTGIATINKRQLSAYPALVPDQAAQERFQMAQDKTSPLLAKLFKEVEQAEALFASLSQRAFRGDL